MKTCPACQRPYEVLAEGMPLTVNVTTKDPDLTVTASLYDITYQMPATADPLVLTEKHYPILAEIWDNEEDAIYE